MHDKVGPTTPVAYKRWMKRCASLYQGLKRAGLRESPSEFRQWLWNKAKLSHGINRPAWRCYYCWERVTLANVAVDHFIPVSRGGATELANLAIAHKICNRAKGDLSASTFGSLLGWCDRIPERERKDIIGRLATGTSIKAQRLRWRKKDATIPTDV